MITSRFTGIRVGGIATALPTTRIDNMDYAEKFGEDTVKKNIQMTGIKESYHCSPEQTVSDLGFAAAENLLNEKQIDRSTIGALIFVASYADYFSPATSFVLQKRLGLPIDCAVYDINLACSGFIYGVQAMCSLMQCSNIERGLIIIGDSTSKTASPLDKSCMLFGDAGSAILLEKSAEARDITICVRSDGNRFKSIIVPEGAFRRNGGSRERVEWADGNIRSDYDLYLNGTDVFNFAITDAPKLILEYLEATGTTSADYDCLLLHQANLFIMKHVAKKAGFKMDRVPVSLDRYGNSSGTTIPVTICDRYAGGTEGRIHALASGFGAGLSWGVMNLDFNTEDILPIIHTDDYYKDGGVSHE